MTTKVTKLTPLLFVNNKEKFMVRMIYNLILFLNLHLYI